MVAVSCSVLAVVVVVSISCCGRLVVVDVFSSCCWHVYFCSLGNQKGQPPFFWELKNKPFLDNDAKSSSCLLFPPPILYGEYNQCFACCIYCTRPCLSDWSQSYPPWSSVYNYSHRVPRTQSQLMGFWIQPNLGCKQQKSRLMGPRSGVVFCCLKSRFDCSRFLAESWKRNTFHWLARGLTADWFSPS